MWAALLLAFLFDRASSYGGRWRVSSIATAMALSAFALFTWIYRIDERSYAGYLGARHTADWLREHTPQDAVIAGWDVGIVGAYSDRRVANLDGLINSWDFKENYFDKGLTERWLDKIQPPVDFIAQYFWESQMNPETLGHYRDVNLLRWKVVFVEELAVRTWDNLGKTGKQTYLVLSRSGPGVSLEEYLSNRIGTSE